MRISLKVKGVKMRNLRYTIFIHEAKYSARFSYLLLCTFKTTKAAIVLKDFAKLTGKLLLQTETLLKKRPCEFREIFKNTSFTEHLPNMVAEMLQKEFLCDIEIYFYSIK